ncbi:hypothetical protein DFJ73DRAFT_836164 [Zopfochytrium polystomum]|nr:hypothetical protein DFJ73DRAFT_836164 [Zopfochytrium polystomum]
MGGLVTMGLLGSWLLVQNQMVSLIFGSLVALVGGAVVYSHMMAAAAVEEKSGKASFSLSVNSASSDADLDGLDGLDDDDDYGAASGPLFYHFYPSMQILDSADDRDKLAAAGLDYFKVFFGPASGPRGFATCGFERELCALAREGKLSNEKWLAGASTGALRFVALITSLVSEADASDQLKEHFCEMTYRIGDTPAILRGMMEACYRICLPPSHIDAVLNHPTLRLAIFVAQVNPRYADYPEWRFKCLAAWYAARHVFDTTKVAEMLSRVCFYSGDEAPEFLADGLGGKESVRFVKLTRDNIYEVLHATTCVPYVQEHCTHITGVGTGLFFDGALTDFSMNTHLTSPSHPGLLLSDSLTRLSLRPTVFDSYTPWRAPPAALFTHASVVCPTQAFVDRLPDRKLPHIRDWFNPSYIAFPESRKRNWRECFRRAVEDWPASEALLDAEVLDRLHDVGERVVA